MKFGLECPITDRFIAELTPLLEHHFSEVARFKDIALDPDWEFYKKAAEVGIWRFYTMRTDELALAGYAAFIVQPNRHYSSSRQANCDVFYVVPGYRNPFTTVRFLNWCDTMLKELGVQVVYHRAKVYLPALGQLLERFCDYEHVENCYLRRLK